MPLKAFLWAGWGDRSAAVLPEDLHSRTQHLHGGSKLSPGPRDPVPYLPLQASGMHVVGVQTRHIGTWRLLKSLFHVKYGKPISNLILSL